MPVTGVVPLNPCGERLFQLQRTGPLAEPEQLFLEGPHEPFRIRVPLRVVVTGEGLGDTQGRRGLHEGERGGLTAIVTHEMEPVVTAPVRELALHRHVQCGQPVRRFGLQSCIVADNFLGVPVQHQDEVHPARGFDHHLGHINAPPLIRGRRARLAPRRRPGRLQSGIALHHQALLLHQPSDALLVHRSPSPTRGWAQIRR